MRPTFCTVALMATTKAAGLVIERAATVTVQICTGQNGSGTCMKTTIVTQDQCLGYSGSSWDNTMRSINIPSGFHCRFWDSNSCNGDSTPDISGGGWSNLGDKMANKATSFKCYVGE